MHSRNRWGLHNLWEAIIISNGAPMTKRKKSLPHTEGNSEIPQEKGKPREFYAILHEDLIEEGENIMLGEIVSKKWAEDCQNTNIKPIKLIEHSEYQHLTEMLAVCESALSNILDENNTRVNWGLQDYETAMRHDEHEARYALDKLSEMRKR